MIRRPARIAGVRFERRGDTDEALDDVLRDAAAAQPASLPLLQFALDELSKACARTKVLTFAAYEALGGIEGALRARAEATISGLSSAAQSALSPVIARLVQVRLDGAVGQIGPPRRDSMPFREALNLLMHSSRHAFQSRCPSRTALMRTRTTRQSTGPQPVVSHQHILTSCIAVVVACQRAQRVRHARGSRTARSEL